MAGNREEQMKEITERLEQGVKEMFTSEKYTEYLKTMSQFHNYSFNNTVLIAMQKPGATLVAGYGVWGKKFNRQVKRGEKGIRIIAPAPVRWKEEIEKFDPNTNEPVLRADGQPETEEIEHVIPRFRISTVFDISQTYGDPLPGLDTPELMGNVENYPVFMEAVKNISPVPMRYTEIEGDSKGHYNNTAKEIVIKDGMSEKQTMKTAIHEVTHAMCHDRDIMERMGEKKDQMTREVEAESVAFSVCSYFGLDTSDYSFPYIAGWSGSMEMKELRSSMEFIRKTAASFIDSMVENIRKLQKEKEAKMGLSEDELVFRLALPGKDAKRFYRVDNVGRADFLRLLQIFSEEKGENRDVVQFLKAHGVHLHLWKDSEDPERNENMPVFYDIFYNNAEHIVDASSLPALVRVELIISRAEYGHTALPREQHNLAVRHAYKLDDLKETKKLVEKLIEAAENPGSHDVKELMEDAQAEIDSLPDSRIGLMQMHEFGYRKESVLPLKEERAMALHRAGLHIYSLHADGSSVLMNTVQDILETGGIFGVDAGAWDSYLAAESVREKNGEQEIKQENVPEGNAPQEMEAAAPFSEGLLYTDTADRYGIFQVDKNGKGSEYLFFGTDFIQEKGMEVEGGDYLPVYGGSLGKGEDLDTIYEKFNCNHPEGYTGHSLSVSDVVVINRSGQVSAHFVDSFGFTELPDFAHQREQLIGIETAPDLADTKEAAGENKEKEITAGQEKTAVSEPEKPAASITFYAAESMGFPVLGEYHDRLETLQEAIDLYEKMPAGRVKGQKGFGFCLEDGSEYAGNCELMLAGRTQTEFVNDIRHYKDSPLVQKAIADMEAILAERAGKDKPELPKETEAPKQDGIKTAQKQEKPKIKEAADQSAGKDAQAQTKAPELEKPAQTAPQTAGEISRADRKQSVLNALRERQAKLRAQEKQGQKPQAHRKGGQEL